MTVSTYLATASAYYSDDCSKLLDDCEFYTCMETKRACGPKGYQVGFGRKYCLKFTENQTKFSYEGQGWLNRTKLCLMKKLLENHNEVVCDSIKKQAFKDHIACYYDSGYCELSGADKWNIMKIVGSSILKPKLFKSGFKIQRRCSKKRNWLLKLIKKRENRSSL